MAKKPVKALKGSWISRLCEAVDSSYDSLQPFRETNFYTVKQYCGSHYGKLSQDMKRVPVNFIQMATEIYLQSIVPIQPQFMVRTPHYGMKPTAHKLQLAINHVSNEIDMYQAFRMAVFQSFFSMGIIKTGTAIMDRGTRIDRTMPYADFVSFDDFVFDTTAKRFEECQFTGNIFRMDYEEFMDSDLYRNKDNVTTLDGQAMREREENVYSLSSSANGVTKSYRDQVILREIYLPRENMIVTIPGDGSEAVLREAPYQGYETGPYHLLRYNQITDNIMPVAPTGLWLDLHEFGNEMFIKLSNQTRRQKTVLGYGAAGKDDAERIKSANDGEIIAMNNPEQVREFRFGGPDQAQMAMFIQNKDLFNWFGGNIDLLGGLSPSSSTATQDQQLGTTASKRLEVMRQAFQMFAMSVGRSVANEIWYNPTIELPLVEQLPNTGMEIPVEFSTDALEGDYLDYNVNIDPFSLVYLSPQERLSALGQIMERFILPALPLLQQQGASINAEEYMSVITQYSNMPELRNIVSFSNPQQMSGDEGPVNPTAAPAKTTREYVRKNVPTGGTRQFRDSQMAMALFGRNTQPKEQQAAAR
jgi:hypothetical protein